MKVSCDFCGEQSATLQYVLRDFCLGLEGNFYLVRCNRCGLFYLNPQPTWEELQLHYQNRYDSLFEKRRDPITFRISRYGSLRRRRIILRYQRRGRLLDVGCGDGSFLQEMARNGQWELYGIDPMLSAQSLRDDQGIKIYRNDLIQSEFPDDFFDVVTWWDALEHVPNPSVSLRETYRILKPGGWVFIQTPDPNSWDARVFGPYWMGFDAPRHLYLFPSRVLLRRLSELGFRVERVTRFAGGVATLFRSLGYWFDSKGWRNLRELMMNMEQSSFIRLTTAPLSFLMRRFGMVFSLLYIAQKPSQEQNV